MSQKLPAGEARRLLAEYAAGTITADDRRHLMAAALEDQALFERLAEEQPLADLMADPQARAELRAALQVSPRAGIFDWLWRPWPVAALASVAAVGLFLFLWQFTGTRRPESDLALLATKEKQAAMEPGPVGENRLEEAPLADKESARPAAPARQAPPQKTQGKPEKENLLSSAPSLDIKDAPLEKSKGTGNLPAAPQTSAEAKADRAAGDERIIGGISAAPPPAVKSEAARAPVTQKVTLEPHALWQVPPESKPAAAVPFVTYRLLRLGENARFQEVPADTRFRSGDIYRLSVELQEAGYLAAAEQAGDGSWQLLYPREGEAMGFLAARSALLLPAGSPWSFGTPAHSKRILLAWYPTALPVRIPADGSEPFPDAGRKMEILLPAAP